jgi:hypothetical protein
MANPDKKRRKKADKDRKPKKKLKTIYEPERPNNALELAAKSLPLSEPGASDSEDELAGAVSHHASEPKSIFTEDHTA